MLLRYVCLFSSVCLELSVDIIIQLAYHDVSGERASKGLYPTLFSVNQVTTVLTPLRLHFMEHFKWTRVGTIASHGQKYEDVSNAMFLFVWISLCVFNKFLYAVVILLLTRIVWVRKFLSRFWTHALIQNVTAIRRMITTLFLVN